MRSKDRVGSIPAEPGKSRYTQIISSGVISHLRKGSLASPSADHAPSVPAAPGVGIWCEQGQTQHRSHKLMMNRCHNGTISSNLVWKLSHVREASMCQTQACNPSQAHLDEVRGVVDVRELAAGRGVHDHVTVRVVVRESL